MVMIMVIDYGDDIADDFVGEDLDMLYYEQTR